MKLLIFLVSFNLFAHSLPPGSTGISQITDIALLNLEPKTICENENCSDYTQLEIEFVLHGCMDELGPVFLKVKQVEKKFILFLNATNIHTKESEGVKCFLPKRVSKVFHISSEINRDNLFFSFLEESKD